MSNCERFLQLYNKLDELMRTALNENAQMSHAKLIERFVQRDAVLQEQASRLQAYRALRNSIVHKGPNEPEPIAEPHDAVVDSYEQLVNYIERPPTALDVLAITSVWTIAPDAEVTATVEHMLKNSYRLAPVLIEGRLAGVFTFEAIAQFLLVHPERCGELPSLNMSDLWELIAPVETLQSFVLASDTLTVAEVELVFQQRFLQRQFTNAMLLMEGEELKGIITAHDLPSSNRVARAQISRQIGLVP